MRLDREARRTVAQFLNGMAVAVTTVMLITPIAGAKADIWMGALGVLLAVVLHALALLVAAAR